MKNVSEQPMCPRETDGHRVPLSCPLSCTNSHLDTGRKHFHLRGLVHERRRFPVNRQGVGSVCGGKPGGWLERMLACRDTEKHDEWKNEVLGSPGSRFDTYRWDRIRRWARR